LFSKNLNIEKKPPPLIEEWVLENWISLKALAGSDHCQLFYVLSEQRTGLKHHEKPSRSKRSGMGVAKFWRRYAL